MKFAMEFSETYPHPVSKVWTALTDPAALGAWLMETDFAPEPGRAFTMWCDGAGGGIDTYRCRLLEIEPERRMLWAWNLEGHGAEPPMTVEFIVEAVEEGTKLTVVHSGDRDDATIGQFRSGWPGKLEQLAATLSARP